MSFAQERLWFVNAAAPESPIYNVPLFFRWRGEVDPGALHRALLAVVEKHEVLRTTYQDRDGERVQVVGEARVAVEVVSHAPDVEARRGFDLATEPPVRCAVWKGQPDGDAVLLTIHHIAVDGWSLPALFDDLGTAYDAEVAGRRPELGELPVQYADFAVWDRAGLDDQLLARRAAELAEVPTGLKLGGARPVPAGFHSGEQHRFTVPAATWEAVGELARRLRATPFVVLLAAWSEVVGRWSARDEFLIGAVTANRTHPAVEDLVGFFVNTVPLRCTTRPPTFAQRCAELRREAFGSMTYQRIPFDQLVARTPGRGLAEVGFALQNMPAPDTARWTAPDVLPTGTAKYDVLLIVEETADGVMGTLELDTELYPAELGPRLAGDFAALLGHAVAEPEAPLAEFALPNGPLERPRPLPVSTVEIDRGDLTEPERRAAELFRAVLAETGVEIAEPARNANFFTLGGHSLLAVGMLARARREHGAVVRPSEFLAEPTVARLGALLRAGTEKSEPAAADDGPRPATSTQQRFWFLDRIPELRAAYLVPTVVHFPSDSGVEELRDAVDTVLARHPSLRSRFHLDHKQKRVVRTTSGPPARATVTDARGWDEGKLSDHVAELCWTPFDLANEAPVRAELVLVATGVRLVLCAHHMVVDGASVRVLLEQVAAVVQRRELPEPVDPAPVGERGDASELIAALEGAPTDVRLPHDRPRVSVQSILGATCTTTFAEAPALRAVAKESGCSTFLATVAVLAVALARRSDQRDFLFAFPWSGREHPDAVGMFVNTLVLRADLRGDPTWREVLDRVRRSASVAYRAADVPFDEVVSALHPQRDLSRPALTPVYVAAEDEWRPPLGGELLPLDPLAVKYELELTVTETPAGLRLTAAYQTDLFDDTTIKSLLADVTDVTTALMTNPDGPACEEKLR
ncbi:condensation domain-containing protein [Lentzea sp.]|uniref:condensation domain-containing protein n=1 Tax=Lentzea sp. TaxID=56099 RepID=UPI002C13D0D1|nr:condensation domain-containing protein [Lentzea sp.]HUQ61464.1 condensation domain-containing protein [Lentzea sp.]